MLVLLPHITVFVCSIYTVLVNSTIQVDMQTDGRMGGRETEMQRREEKSQKSTVSCLASQADKTWKLKRGDEEKLLYVSVFAYCTY